MSPSFVRGRSYCFTWSPNHEEHHQCLMLRAWFLHHMKILNLSRPEWYETGTVFLPVGPPTVVDVNMNIRSMGPISEKNMVSHPTARTAASPKGGARSSEAQILCVGPSPCWASYRRNTTLSSVIFYRYILVHYCNIYIPDVISKLLFYNGFKQLHARPILMMQKRICVAGLPTELLLPSELGRRTAKVRRPDTDLANKH